MLCMLPFVLFPRVRSGTQDKCIYSNYCIASGHGGEKTSLDQLGRKPRIVWSGGQRRAMLSWTVLACTEQDLGMTAG